MGYAAPKTVDREPPRLFQPRILRLRNDNAPPRNATWRSSPTRSRSPIAPSTKDLSRQHWLTRCWRADVRGRAIAPAMNRPALLVRRNNRTAPPIPAYSPTSARFEN